jgi:hypothetical protein
MNKFNQWMRSFGRLVLGFALVVTAHPSFKVLAAEKQLTVIGISDLHGALQVERLETLNQQKVERVGRGLGRAAVVGRGRQQRGGRVGGHGRVSDV